MTLSTKTGSEVFVPPPSPGSQAAKELDPMATVSRTPKSRKPTQEARPAMVPANGSPRTLAERIDDEARAYREQGDSFGIFISSHIERLAQLVRWTGAQTPDQHDERMEV